MLKDRAIAQKLGSALFAGLLVATAGITIVAGSASATECTDWLSKEVVDNGRDQFRASVLCTEISADRKVRAQLARDGQTDRYSSYFTTENKTYHTGWNDCIFGCTAEHQVADV